KVTHLPHAGDHHHDSHGHGHGDGGVHESPWVMVFPLQILAVLSVIGGFIGIPHMSWIEKWLEPVIPASEGVFGGVSPGMEWVLMGLSLAGAIIGILIARKIYKSG